ncbi:hypothetical protein ABEB36_001936 [Hypothenemus hampei]|uniref:Uncharacterized protein n=1 Tax=Hypothenemus hampei TaxID=57062 RepID=A0ABD1FGA5_HYPHA
MFLTRDKRTYVKAIGILVIIQGLAWFVFSVIGIVLIHSPPNRFKNRLKYHNYGEYLAQIIYNEFIEYSSLRDEKKVIRPADFQAFLWIYAVLSVVWVAAAFDQHAAIKWKKFRQSYVVFALGVILIFTSVIDLVFFSLLTRDFSTCPFEVSSDASTLIPILSTPATVDDLSTTITVFETASPTNLPTQFTSRLILEVPRIDCQVANGIVMSLAARGYVLWFVNVVLGMHLIVIAMKVNKNPFEPRQYGTARIPRVRMPSEAPRKPGSVSNDSVFYGDSVPIPVPKDRNGTPIALTNKNPNIYY